MIVHFFLSIGCIALTPCGVMTKRLQERGDLNDKIERRLAADEKDFEGFTDYDIVVNNPNF